ncbi:MAG: hypothetical protein LBJ74_05635 [Heliobacteriaceae bacterium]|jgi:hypothetical protein|nr:hypothetical protein [Heliobacteriaceae bacterium]
MKTDKINSINFMAKMTLPAEIIIQAAAGKSFTPNAYSGFRDICKQLYTPPIMIPGHVGFAKYAFAAGKQIAQKYKNVAEATDEIIRLYQENPNIKSAEVNDYFQKNIIPKLGKEMEIDVELEKPSLQQMAKLL